ncbi:hypothetical protein BpHYR1_047734 [Brachionus plicatilis]|uniref:Uncharacterized protein n=1 Tax=Brachionus plicatilis TaxID=10195 RepID=A0A3M7PMD8_BRAPC|nr:hypothetical protein BpHYR1_047734 [Brachionus plicatilis]
MKLSNYRNALPPNALHFKPEFWILMLHFTHFFSRYAANKNAAVNVKILHELFFYFECCIIKIIKKNWTLKRVKNEFNKLALKLKILTLHACIMSEERWYGDRSILKLMINSKYHFNSKILMDNFSNTWTIIQLGGQLDKKIVHQSDIYNCPWTIVHEWYKTLFYIFNAAFIPKF